MTKATSVEIESEMLMKTINGLGLTKAELARLIGYTREQVTRSINAGRMSEHMLRAIGLVLGIDATVYIKGEIE